MTIENSLERIATALEAIVGAIPTETCKCAEATLETPAKTPAKKSAAKKSAPKQEAPVEPTPQVEATPQAVEPEVIEDDLGLDLDDTPQQTYTLDDVRNAISKFISSFGDTQEGKKATLEILKRYNYAKIPEIAEKDFAAIIADVSKGAK